MSQTETITRYLVAAHGRPGGEPGARPRRTRFITISRESGAGGHVLAQRLLDAFEERKEDPDFQGWNAFDRKLCELVASDPKLNVSLRELLDESSLSMAEDVVGMLLGRSPQALIDQKVANTIRELALVGHAIIVGRAGSSLTRDIEGGIHVRLVAPFDVRVERKTREGHASAEAVAKQIRDLDRNRAKLVGRLSHEEIDDPLLYDAVWNTERVSIDVIARSIIDGLCQL